MGDSLKPDDLEDPWCTPRNPRVVGFAEVTAAFFKIKDLLPPTPCHKSHMFDQTGIDLYLKKEQLQYTGSFKERGGLYAMMMLNSDERKRGVIAASAGNHAQALAYHGHRLGIPVTVVMPVIAPILKIERCKDLKANVIVQGKDMAEAKFLALRLAKKEGFTYVNGFDHPHCIAGQGTVGMEILEQVPDVDVVLCSIGGGSLLAGVAVVMKAMKPDVKVIGIESNRCASFAAAKRAGKPVFTPIERTLADGLAVPTVGYNSFVTAIPIIDRVVTVNEEWIPLAILRLVELEKSIVEGAGAVGVAAVLAGLLNDLKGKKVVTVLTGGNIDTAILGKCLERGLMMDGRLLKFKVTVGDRLEGLNELETMLAELGVQIKEIIRERTSPSTDVFNDEMKVLIETTNKEHASRATRAIKKKYESAHFYEVPEPVTFPGA